MHIIIVIKQKTSCIQIITAISGILALLIVEKISGNITRLRNEISKGPIFILTNTFTHRNIFNFLLFVFLSVCYGVFTEALGYYFLL